MARLQSVRDTFLHFLADNLLDGLSVAIPVHAMREDPNDPAAANLQTNAVNVEFLNTDLEVTISTQVCCIDVLNDNEVTAVDWVNSLWTILKSAFYTTLLDYTVPASPVSLKSNIMWDRKSVKFKKVTSAGYTHFTCTLPLQFRPN